MAYTNKLRISNIINPRNNIVKLSRLKVWADDIEVAIGNITVNYSAPDIGNLLTNNTDEATLIAMSMASIEIELASNIYVERFIYIQLQTNSGIEYWPNRFDVSYDHNNADDWRYYNTAGNYKYPGIGNLTELPIFSPGAIAKSVKWTNYSNVINGEIGELETDVFITPNSSSTAWFAQTNSELNSGKWCIEYYSNRGSPPFVNQLCLSSEITDKTNGWPVESAYASHGVGINTGDTGFLFYLWRPGWSAQILTNQSYQLPGNKVTSTAAMLDYFNYSSTFNNQYGVQLLIDFDDRNIIFKSLKNGSQVGYIFTDVTAPLRLSYGQRITGAAQKNGAYLHNEMRPRYNIGYQPFIGDIPDGYTPGFGVNTSVTVPAWTKINPNAIGIYEPDTAHNVSIPLFDYDKAYVRPWDFHKPEDDVQETINISPTPDLILDSLVETVKMVLYQPTIYKMKHIGPVRTTGYGYIKSTISKTMGATVPIRTRVALFDIQMNKLVAATMSNEITGEFEFTFLDEGIQYNVLAYDPALGWVTGIGGPWKATRMPGYENRTFERILISYDT